MLSTVLDRRVKICAAISVICIVLLRTRQTQTSALMLLDLQAAGSNLTRTFNFFFRPLLAFLRFYR